MEHSYPRSHNVTSTKSDELPVPEPSHAERARTLLHLGRVGTLSTWSERQPGYPFGSVMPYALDESGRPHFLISALAMHTRNVKGDARASLLVADESISKDPLGAARVTLVGEVTPLAAPESGAVRELYLEAQPNARYWVDYKDFGFFRMEVVDVYYVGGFGVMGWVAAGEYGEARPDPLAEHAAEIVGHMNDDHAESLVLLARHFGGHEATGAIMTRVDRLGFHLRLEGAEGVRGCRLPFLRQVGAPGEVRRVLVEMVGEARQARSDP